ncbi:hypothetical protein TWF481_001123 [Arthrobotrys musiformis]|uniref:Uncharacterized protein n=1 Tax=Arthrobotrys musiformis TaxID=47236 RepID=A0AAV9WRP2_9PEZI
MLLAVLQGPYDLKHLWQVPIPDFYEKKTKEKKNQDEDDGLPIFTVQRCHFGKAARIKKYIYERPEAGGMMIMINAEIFEWAKEKSASAADRA